MNHSVRSFLANMFFRKTKANKAIKYFSIAPSVIYTDVEWLDKEMSLSDVTSFNLENKHIELIRKVTLVKDVKELQPLTLRIQSEEFDSRMREIHHYFTSYTKSTSENGFATVLVLIKDFYVAKNQIIIRSNDEMFALYEMNRTNERYLFGENYFKSINWSNIVQIAPAANSLVVVSAGSPNWGHFLVDELPRICMFISETPIIEEINIYLYKHNSGQFNQNRIEAIRILFPEHRVQCHLLDKGKVFYFESSKYYSPITFHPFYKNRSLTQLPRLILNSRAEIVLGKTSRKLFCLRRNSARLISEAGINSLRSLFEPLGFLFYYPEEHSTENQFETFAAADLIIGVMGAGMCNSLFTPSGSTVIYIAPEGWEETFFWNLANQLEHNYHAYYSRTNMESETPEFNTLALDIEDFYTFYLDIGN